MPLIALIITQVKKFAWTFNCRFRTSLTTFYAGACSFLPSGDTNLLKTLDRYDNTGDFLRQLEMDNDTLKKAIIQALKNDSCEYLDPKAKGYNRYVNIMFCRRVETYKCHLIQKGTRRKKEILFSIVYELLPIIFFFL